MAVNEVRSWGASARESLIWGGGFTLLRDIAQFGTMLVLVRILSPEDYGSAALAQSIIGLISVISFGTLVVHAFQLRDPADVDWQAHFTAAAVINTVLFFLTLLIAWALTSSERYGSAALPLVGLALVFLVEIPATLRHRMLETQHDWKRFRILTIIGTLLAMSVGLLVAFLGGGVWALVVQVPIFGLPGAIDLFWHGKWRPDWSWSWERYRDIALFGAYRMGAASVARGRQIFEQGILAGSYDFAALGVFTRAVGLGTLIAGRIGSVTMMSLYPVITRAEQRSEQFQRMAGLVLRGVCWTTIPAAALLAVCAVDIVALIYGSKWMAVAPILPMAVASVAMSGINSVLSSLLLANNETRLSLWIDLGSGLSSVLLAFWLIPLGVAHYLAALAGQGVLFAVVLIVFLTRTGGLTGTSVASALLPSLAAAGAGALIVYGIRFLIALPDTHALRITVYTLVFVTAYLLILRAGFPGLLKTLLDVAPAGRRLASFFGSS